MRRVVFNQKGGVGKSTIVCNLAAVAAMHGRRTLVIDLDPQGNASQYLLGEDWDQREANVAAYLEATLSLRMARPDPADFAVETDHPGLWVMPSSSELPQLEPKLASKHKIFKLREACAALESHVDDIYFDTPPAFNFYTLSALIAADRVLVPFDCDEFSRKALYQLLDNVAETRADHNEGLAIEGIVINQFQAQSRLPREVVAELQADKLPVLQPFLSSSVAVKESHRAGLPLVYYRPRHKVAQQFCELYQALA